MKQRMLLAAVIFLACIVRFYMLGAVPVGLHRDEAFLGYNGYSILKTGKDITGNPFPLHLASFLYSPAGYAYAAIAPLFFFGLTPFSIRFASALSGALTVFVVYYLARELVTLPGFLFNKRLKYRGNPATISLLAAVFLAVSPWHINLSRTATENTIAVLFLSLSLLAYFIYIRTQRIWLWLTFLAFATATYAIYQAPRAFLPLIFPVLLLYAWNRIPKKQIAIVLLSAIVCIYIPVITLMLSPELSIRIRTVSVFASRETQLTIDEALREDGVSGTPVVLSRLFHNKLLGYADAITYNYFRHFSYDFLLTDAGFPDRYRIPGHGLLYSPEIICAITGIISIILSKRRLGYVLLWWILMAPVGSAMTFDDVPNLQRTLLVFPVLSIISAYGMIAWVKYLKRVRYGIVAGFIGLVWILWSIFTYLHAYYVHQVHHRPYYRHEGYAALVSTLNRLLPAYDKAIISNHESTPAMFFFVYNTLNPAVVQKLWKESGNTDIGTLSYGPYIFSKDPCPLRATDPDSHSNHPVITGIPGILYVNYAECKTDNPNIHMIDTINRRDGSPVFHILEVIR